MAKVFLDCQIFQTEAYNRGMGKYSLSLLTELFKSSQYKSKHQTVFIFNKNLPLLKDRLKLIQTINKEATIVEADLPINPVEDTQKKHLGAKTQLNEILKDNLGPSEKSVFILLAPFFADFVSAFPDNKNTYKVSIIYDIIPQLIWQKQRIFNDDLYFSHYRLFLEADKLLTISESVRQDLVRLVGVPQDKVKTIDGGPFNVEGKINYSGKNSYVLFPSAPIVHKNNVNAVKGFNKFNKSKDNKYKLVITSNFDEQTRNHLKKLSNHLEFTGNVTDQELAGLYQGCDAVLFASLCEGLGMPVLESVQYNRPVACSDIPVLKEISEKAFYFFDPTSSTSIAKILELAVKRQDWARKAKYYKEVREKYTWERSAEIFRAEIEGEVNPEIKKTKINIRCFDPRQDSAPAKLIEKLYFSLTQYFDVGIIYWKTWKKTSPSFVPYISTSACFDCSTIYITNSLKKPSGLNKRDLHIAIVNKIQTWLSFRSSYQPDFTLYGRKKTYNDFLKINEWGYTDKKSTSESSIKTKILLQIRKNTGLE